MGSENHDLGPIKAQVDRLSALTHQLLALSRPTAVHAGPVCIKELLTHIRPLVQPQADVDGVRIVMHFQKDMPPVCGSASRLEHLFINLFLNSVNAMSSDGGALTVKTRMDDGFVRVDVMDTGKGIEPQHLARIFEPFYTTRANGTGLGLFSAKTIVEDHDGKIDVKSKIGKGSCFSVWLPIVQQEMAVRK
jgi:signal transduction histidine kinase